jgi:hypothetical protein
MSTFSPTYSANPIYDTITSLTNVTAGKIVLNGVTTNTYSNPITASGDFLGLSINGVRKYIKIYKQVPVTIGKYWYSPQSTSWYTLSNWYGDINHTVAATNLPDSSTNVIILSSVGPFINLDSPYWVQPNTINTGTTTITFSSQNAVNVTCSITGTAFFQGNATYNI